MATATYAVSTSKTDVNGVWRKVQAPLQVAAQFMVDEWDMLDDLSEFEVDHSAREITAPLDLTDDIGIAKIPEGGTARFAEPRRRYFDLDSLQRALHDQQDGALD